MAIMGPLQSGLPSPTVISWSFHLLVLDHKDYFFTIPLHPEDCKCFAFNVPTINHQTI